jgi:prophage tail gpP-like protein
MTNERLALVVGGFRYEGFKSIRVARSIESIAGSFALEVSDRWDGKEAPWPIAEEDECRVEIDGIVAIDGYVDKRSLSASATSRTLSYSGRDRAGALVDCSAILEHWTFRNMTLAEFARKIAEPFGVSVAVQAGLVLPKIPKVVVTPGDTAFDAIASAARGAGVLLVSDGAGGVLITRGGRGRATSLVEGENILSASVDYDGAERFRFYVVYSQVAGTDELFGDAVNTRAVGRDLGVRRIGRVWMLRPSAALNVADAKRRADWEARIRAARAEKITVTVQGWKQPDGQLWPLNALTRVVAPRLIGVEGDMLISQVEHALSEQGSVTQLSLVRPDAFTPEPKATVRTSTKGTGGGWKELRAGADPVVPAALSGLLAKLGLR